MLAELRYLHRAYRYRYRVNPGELRFLCSSLKPGQVAVDIGCHKGAYTYWMRRRVGLAGSVVAFEPQPQQVNYLRNLFARMAYDNVHLVPMAVSNSCGPRLLQLRPGKGGSHGASLITTQNGANGALPQTALDSAVAEIELTTIDASFAERSRGPDFIKIDVEGHELAVLEGARRTLEVHRPRLLVECELRHHADGAVLPVFELLHSLGYEGSFFLNGRRKPISEFDPAVHQQVEPGAIRLPRSYVSNFAFVPRS